MEHLILWSVLGEQQKARERYTMQKSHRIGTTDVSLLANMDGIIVYKEAERVSVCVCICMDKGYSQ